MASGWVRRCGILARYASTGTAWPARWALRMSCRTRAASSVRLRLGVESASDGGPAWGSMIDPESRVYPPMIADAGRGRGNGRWDFRRGEKPYPQIGAGIVT